jgi:hypothetical protein
MPALPNGRKFNSSHSQSEMLARLSELRSGRAGTAGGILIVRAHSARLHCLGVPGPHRQEDNAWVQTAGLMSGRMAKACLLQICMCP